MSYSTFAWSDVCAIKLLTTYLLSAMHYFL